MFVIVSLSVVFCLGLFIGSYMEGRGFMRAVISSFLGFSVSFCLLYGLMYSYAYFLQNV